MRHRRWAACYVALLLAVTTGCTEPVPRHVPSPAPATPAGPTAPARPSPTPPPSASSSQSTITTVALRVERWTFDPATESFDTDVMRILTDGRGWSRAGFRFVSDPTASFALILAEADDVDRLCRPYDTEGLYSCQNGPVVALNADRWRTATPTWPSSLAEYRTMLVNHEVGHLLHLHHPLPGCPGPGLPAPVMTQQSTSLEDCTPNPWPLQWEVREAALRKEPLAPPASHDPSDHRPRPPAVRR